GKDGEQDAIHAGFVLEGTHRSSPWPDFSEAPFDSGGCAHGTAISLGFIAKAGEQFVEVGAQTGDSVRILVLEALSQATRCRAGCGGVGGIMILCKARLTLG